MKKSEELVAGQLEYEINTYVIKGHASITGYIKDELQILGIKDYSPFEKYINKSVYELSGGALKKISLLMALHISKGRIILADEPLDMLDDIEADSLSKTIMEYSKTAPFIIATHDIHFDNYADVLLKL